MRRLMPNSALSIAFSIYRRAQGFGLSPLGAKGGQGQTGKGLGQGRGKDAGQGYSLTCCAQSQRQDMLSLSALQGTGDPYKS